MLRCNVTCVSLRLHASAPRKGWTAEQPSPLIPRSEESDFLTWPHLRVSQRRVSETVKSRALPVCSPLGRQEGEEEAAAASGCGRLRRGPARNPGPETSNEQDLHGTLWQACRAVCGPCGPCSRHAGPCGDHVGPCNRQGPWGGRAAGMPGAMWRPCRDHVGAVWGPRGGRAAGPCRAPWKQG